MKLNKVRQNSLRVIKTGFLFKSETRQQHMSRPSKFQLQVERPQLLHPVHMCFLLVLITSHYIGRYVE